MRDWNVVGMLCNWETLEIQYRFLRSSCLPFSSFLYIGIFFPGCLDTSSVTGAVGSNTGKTKRWTLSVRGNMRLNFTIIPMRPQHLLTLGKQFSSVRLNFLMCELGNVWTLSKIVGIKQPEHNSCLMSVILETTSAHELMAVRETSVVR